MNSIETFISTFVTKMSEIKLVNACTS